MKAMLIAMTLLAAASDPPSPQTVVAAEQAFAAEVAAKGVKRGFTAFAAPDGIMFTPAPTNARKSFAAEPDSPPENPPLAWWPDFAGIARSGDLGFTSGPASTPVRYFTVWKKQRDGSWKWIYDGGTPLREKMAGGPETRALLLPLAGAAAGSAEKALAEIAPLEARIAAGSVDDAHGALTSFLTEQALVASSPVATVAGGDHQAALAARPAAMTLRGLGQSASAAGDMVFTYGEARWAVENQPRWGHYVRIWQKQTEDDWKLVADLLINAPGTPPNPS